MENSKRRDLQDWSPQWLSKTPITLRGTLSALTISIACALMPTDGQACSFTNQVSIVFKPDVSLISNRDRVDLANKLIDVGNGVDGIAMVVVYGYTIEGQRHGSAITKKRVESVIAYLRSLGMPADKINADYEIWRATSSVPESERWQILVEFLPIKSPCG